MKPYKASTPQDTIHRIRTILHDIGIFTTEQHLRNEGMYYSCTVYVDNDDSQKYEIRANGKGMTAEYALASAYAELMERLENRMSIFAIKYATTLFRKNNSLLNVDYIPKLHFRYFPDETFKEISADELWILCQRLMPNVANNSNKHSLGSNPYKMYFADFYNAKEDIVEHLPYHLLRLTASSTGLCAGNIPEEAILQGIYEIFERYVLQQIYLQRLTPPTIPFEVFANTEIAQRLKRLQAEKGWTIIVKDCSLGRGFPVVGLLLIDNKKNRYAFRLGADLSPVIALQRCFTEAFQGADASERFLQPILLDDNWNLTKEHDQSVVNGTGRFPRQIFSTQASWAFNGFALKEQPTYAGDMKYIKQWIEKNGYTLYVRDNSFLGFPAYHLYIPGLSETDARLYNVLKALQRDNEIFFKVTPEYRLHSLNATEKDVLIEKYKDINSPEISLFLYNSNRFNRFNRMLLLALLSYSLGKDKEAYQHMCIFLDDKAKQGNQQDTYYYCVRDMFFAKSLSPKEDEVVCMLANIYSENLVKEVLSDMSDRTNVLRNFPLPVCFECDKCRIKQSCSYPTIAKLEYKIQQNQLEHPIQQKHLHQLFYT